MSAYDELERKIRARGVRVDERLALLRTLERRDGAERLAARLDQHERAIERAARQVRAVIR